MAFLFVGSENEPFFKLCEEKENEEEEEKRRGVVRDAAFGAGGRGIKFIELGSYNPIIQP